MPHITRNDLNRIMQAGITMDYLHGYTYALATSETILAPNSSKEHVAAVLTFVQDNVGLFVDYRPDSVFKDEYWEGVEDDIHAAAKRTRNLIERGMESKNICTPVAGRIRDELMARLQRVAVRHGEEPDNLYRMFWDWCTVIRSVFEDGTGYSDEPITEYSNTHYIDHQSPSR